MSKISLIRNIGILLVSAACFAACTPEEYGPCSLPNTTGLRVACAPMGESKTATCTADYVFDCDSLICGIYNSSTPFCTQRCIPNEVECKKTVTDEAKCTVEGDSKGVSYMKCPEGKNCVETCPEGAACVEWTPGTGGFFCLPNDKRGQGNYTPSTGNNNSSNTGSNNSSNDGNDNTGTDDTGSDNTGADDTGSNNTGAGSEDNSGAEENA